MKEYTKRIHGHFFSLEHFRKYKSCLLQKIHTKCIPKTDVHPFYTRDVQDGGSRTGKYEHVVL